MTTKLYIGGLSYVTSDEGLRDAFAQAGTVASATVIRDRMTGVRGASARRDVV
jgi:RNA recognition motif-containing protein